RTNVIATFFINQVSLSIILRPHAHLPDHHSFPTRRSSDLLQRSLRHGPHYRLADCAELQQVLFTHIEPAHLAVIGIGDEAGIERSEEHTSELQSRENLVCRLLLEKKKKNDTIYDDRDDERH